MAEETNADNIADVMKNAGLFVINENKTILESFKNKIKEVPLAQRGQALAIYNILQKFCKFDDESDTVCKQNFKIFEEAQIQITTQSDMVIEGQRKVNEDELPAIQEFLNEGEELKDEANDGERIPDYWLQCFKNKKLMISELDEPILKNITHLDIQGTGDDPEDKDKKKSTSLTLTFAQNEFFTNTELKATLEFKGEEPDKLVGTEINWNEGKDPTQKKVSKKQKSKKTGKTRTIEKIEKCDSFFNLFKSCNSDMPDDYDEEDGGDMGVDMNVWEANDILESILEVGPYSLEYYLDCNHEEEDDDEDDEDDDDFDEDEEDDEDDEPKKKPRKKSSTGGDKKKKPKKKSGDDAAPEGADAKEQECKQN